MIVFARAPMDFANRGVSHLGLKCGRRTRIALNSVENIKRARAAGSDAQTLDPVITLSDPGKTEIFPTKICCSAAQQVAHLLQSSSPHST